MKKTLYIAPAIEILQIELNKPVLNIYTISNRDGASEYPDKQHPIEGDPDSNNGEVGSKGFTGGWDDEW